MKQFFTLLLLCAALVEARSVRVKLFSQSKPDPSVIAELKTRFSVNGDRVATMPLEHYVAYVLAGEAATFDASEALRAMAVAARTFALHHLGRHAKEDFDLCDTTHCQDFRANSPIRAALREAVDSTEGQILRFGKDAAAAFYHRNCGGTTAASDEVWPGLVLPYLRSQPDTYCVRGGPPRWKSEVRRTDLAGAIRVADRTRSGRVQRIDIDGRVLPAEQFASLMGRRFGWTALRSNRYEITVGRDTVRFDGTGYGHGVGLCQSGAQARAAAGHGYDRILAFYYPGTKLGWAGGAEDRWHLLRTARAEISAPDEATARELAELTERALAAVSRLGLTPPENMRLRTYTTIARYRDATGAAGWEAATTLGRTVRLQPLPALRSAGVLYETVLHELLHIAVDSEAREDVPSWFREGLVLALSRPTGAPSASTRAPEQVRASYRRAELAVRSLLREHGQPTVLRWLRSGVPAEIARAFAARRTGPAHN